MITRERILIIRLSALGDVVHTLAFVNRLRTARPHAHITWILQPLAFELVRHQQNIDRFIVFSRSGGLKALGELFRQLNRERFDLVFMLQVSIKASLVSLCVRGDRKLGYDFRRSREGQWLFANSRIARRPAAHVLDQFFEFLDHLHLAPAPLDWAIRITEEERAWQDRFFRAISRPVAAFVVASSKPDKDWPAERYAEVMDAVDKRLNLQPMLVGGPSRREHAISEEIVGRCRCRPVIALERPVRHTLLQLAGARVVVAPDTGPMHMAVALNVPTVALYGYSDPRRCGPYQRFADLVIDKYTMNRDTRQPITRKTRPGRMAMITPAEVLAKIELALARYQPLAPAPAAVFTEQTAQGAVCHRKH